MNMAVRKRFIGFSTKIGGTITDGMITQRIHAGSFPTSQTRGAAPNKIAAANSHRPFSFDADMEFEHHHSRLSPQPVAVAAL